MAVIAAVIAGIKTAGELASAIKDVTGIIPNAPSELTQKHRWMTVTIFNQTQFRLVFKKSWYDTGGPWQAPTDVPKFSSVTFSVCNKDNSILTGVTGGVTFTLQMPLEGGGYQDLDIGVGFARPEVGTVKCSAIYTDDPEKAYNAVNSGTTSHTSNKFSGDDVHGKEVTINFLTVASPGREASVTITQQILSTK
jgi:hypothetical protein